MATAHSNEQASAFSPDRLLAGPDAAKLRDALAAAGIRTLPFGFGSAVAVASDVDGSRRERYFGYVGQLVDRLGLDFGDSTWLQWQVTNGRGRGLGFFSPDLNMGRDTPSALFEGTRTFLESVGEHHKGNIDHFHAFYANGPRVAVLHAFRDLGDGRVVFEVGACQKARPWHCAHFRIVGLCVVGRTDRPMDVRSVAVVEADGTRTDAYRPAAFAGPGDRPHRLFTHAADEARSLPLLDRARTIVIDLAPTSHAQDVERLLISSTFGEVVLERLNFLKEHYNIDITLITEHSALHFRNPLRAEADDTRLKDHVGAFVGPLEAYYGTLTDAEGHVVFSTDADHPLSLCRVFPAISAEQELRFIVPRAASGECGFDPLNLVTPSPTRSGGGIYWARRVLPDLATVSPQQGVDTAPRQADFAGRLANVLKLTEQEPGLFWPIYTHLGGLAGDAAPVPDPYFEPGPLLDLQDRVFNLSGQVGPVARLWFTRATVLYDYALILRSIAPHVSRPDGNTVLITSWRDHVLGKRLPRSKGQLYGLTFHVDDPERAEIRLDGERLETIVVNRADETGRPSVTIAESDIRHILFDRLDPLANAAAEAGPANGTWTWRPAAAGERTHGRLTVGGERPARTGSREAMASLTLPLHGWVASGAQLVTLALRRCGASRVGLIFTTRTGGRFHFGDPSLGDMSGQPITATYNFRSQAPAREEWRRVTVPFHDLTWNPGAREGGPLPSHPLESLTILCAGPAGAWADIGEVSFLRPRTTTGARQSSRGFCLGGRLATFNGGETVSAAPRDPHGQPVRKTQIDHRGWFCFEQSAPGLYEVWAEHGGRAMHDRRGRLVEVGVDTMTLWLDHIS